MDSQKFCLKWDGFQGSVTSVFDQLRSGGELLDVTLCCEGQRVRAHRMMLSACNLYLRELLKVGDGKCTWRPRGLGGLFSELLTGDGGESSSPLRELTELPSRPAPSAPSSPPADPTNENDTDALRHCWQRKLKESVAARLPEDTCLHQPPSRYIFPGAGVLVDPDDSDSDRDSLDSDRGSDDESPTAEGDHPNNSTDTPETAVTPPHTDSCPPTPPGRITTSGASLGASGTSSSSPAEEQPSSTPAVKPSSTSDIEMEPETVGSSGSALKKPISETLGGEEGSGVKRPAFGGMGEPGVSPATAKTAPATAAAGDSGSAQSAGPVLVRPPPKSVAANGASRVPRPRQAVPRRYGKVVWRTHLEASPMDHGVLHYQGSYAGVWGRLRRFSNHWGR
ncbi:nucleolar and coiled-body phosphoprotein 1-like [Amphibalanus amphitrite]|uniref:nucleolar and coiled-body phosphoprotein 1-like n=1 Tax=Amphibalanus amphitrite TaxID=1232801 RepID=UPI001C919DED|nr:nucleolar and coiled-body phosphoprotein 1-like [Amphibalanus amphitrite]